MRTRTETVNRRCNSTGPGEDSVVPHVVAVAAVVSFIVSIVVATAVPLIIVVDDAGRNRLGGR
jgi:hypothetical protein